MKDEFDILLDNILKDFIIQLSIYLEKCDEIKDYSLKTFDGFLDKIFIVKDLVREDLKNKLVLYDDDLANDYYLFSKYGSWFDCPYELKIVKAHYSFIYSVYMTFLYIFPNYDYKDEKDLCSVFDILRKKMVHSLLLNNKKMFYECYNLFSDVIKKEKEIIEKWTVFLEGLYV